MAHLDRPYGDWPQAVTSVPADAMGLRQHGRVAAGLPANLVIFRGRRYSELLSRPQYDRVRRRTAAAAWSPRLFSLHRDLKEAVPRRSPTELDPGGCRPVGQHRRPSLCLPPAQVVVRDGRPLDISVPAYEELDYVPQAIRKGELLEL
jgi:hypothetical protein